MTAQARLLGSRYQVGELLGYGGMAEVHRGRDLRLGRDVAIKMLRSDLARDATFQLRFQREAQNAASLNHPAIVSVYDTGEERGPTGETLPYIVMEFVNGRTLKEILGAEGRLMPRRALEITADICAAIEFSHRHGIIHRDIKPGNVMLTQTGQVKVMDFGIARALASGASTMTQTSAVIGTAQYLSPEQARGEAVDARSDVYATGCVLFELLTGHPPFTGDNPVSVAYQHVREDAPPPSDANPDVPPDVDAVVLKALAKNPINRYQSAGEMRADLLRAATGRQVYATPVLRRDEMMSTMGRSMPTQVVGAPRHTGTMARAGTPQRRRASGLGLGILGLIAVLGVIAVAIGLYMATTNSKVAVPRLVGLTGPQAVEQLNANGLTGVSQDDKSATCTKGQVTDQDPDEGTKLDKQGKVTYTVCVGPDNVQIPAGLKGMDKDAATRMLQEKGLKVDAQPRDSTEEANKVLEVNPKEGTPVQPGSEVTIWYSRGNQFEMPEVLGKGSADAKRQLEELGLKVTVSDNYKPEQGVKDGEVTGQNPSPGTKVSKGQEVVIIVARVTEEPPTTPPATPTSPAPTGSSGG